jgi:2-oxoglutarate ferredoxin oxidoreductase subunit beta
VPADDASVVRHDAHADDPSYAFALSRLATQDLRYSPIGVFRSVERPSYDDLMAEQLDQAKAKGGGDLASLLHGSDTWTIA